MRRVCSKMCKVSQPHLFKPHLMLHYRAVQNSLSTFSANMSSQTPVIDEKIDQGEKECSTPINQASLIVLPAVGFCGTIKIQTLLIIGCFSGKCAILKTLRTYEKSSGLIWEKCKHLRSRRDPS